MAPSRVMASCKSSRVRSFAVRFVRTCPPRSDSQRSAGDDGGIEVGFIVGCSLSRFRKGEFEGDVGFGPFYLFHQGNGVELPLAGFGAVAVGFVESGVVNPDLTDVALRD
jgi:hypothetical protein